MAVSQSTDYLTGEGADSGNRQFILVLIGVCIILSQMYFLSARSMVPILKETNIAVTYRINDSGDGLFFESVRGREEKSSQHETANFPAEIAPLFFQPIPLNIASADLLIIIPGIGPHLAHEIHDYITNNGGMTEISDLKKIRGIGIQKSKLIAKYVRI